MKLLRFLSFVLLFASTIAIAERLGCRDESGELIDWYYLYKLPKSIEDNETGATNSGLNYLFITPDSTDKWTLSKRLVNDSLSIPGRTLGPIYNDKSDNNLAIMYNDEPTNAKSDESRGHTKGVVLGNDISGLWLIHSVPKFPPSLEEGHYDYPKTGAMYGQSFLCISFTADEMDKIGKQLKFNEPQFYSTHVPPYLKTIYPQLVDALKMTNINKTPFYNLETLRSRKGTKFLSFAKSRKFNQELYDDLVAPHFDAGDYYVETWRHGAGNIDSDCRKPSKVYNVEEIHFKSSNIAFSTMHDHSKWIVSEDHNLICVGDINRQEHQKVRGGGTVCQQAKVSRTYNDLVSEVEKCKKGKKYQPSELSNRIPQNFENNN